MSRRAAICRQPSTRRSLATASRSIEASRIAARFACRRKTAAVGSSSRPTTKGLRRRVGGSARPRRPPCRSWSPRQDQSSKPIRPRIITVSSASRSRRATVSTCRALLQIGAEEGTAEALPHHLIVDRCYLHGDPRRGARRGVALNSRDSAVINSYLSDFKEVGADSQAIVGWNGPGPFRIANNYLEAAGENVMFGGADPKIRRPGPGRHRGRRQPPGQAAALEDRTTRAFEGTAWSVKNLFELKNARRVLVDGNLFEYNWPHAQNGFAILFTPSESGRRGRPGRSSKTSRSSTTSCGMSRPASTCSATTTFTPASRRAASRSGTICSWTSAARGDWAAFQLLDGTSDVIDRSQHGAADRQLLVRRRSRAAYRVRLSEQHRVSQSVRIHRIGYAAPAGRPSIGIFRARVPPQCDRRRNAPTAIRQTISFRRRPTGGLRRSAEARLSAQAVEQLQACRHRPPGCRGRRRKIAATAGKPARADFRGSNDGRPLPSTCWFWVALALLVYVYVGYPLVAWLRAVRARAALSQIPSEPFVTVIVVAYNEAQRIGRRIENLLSLDYPRDKSRSSSGRMDPPTTRRFAPDGSIRPASACGRSTAGAGRPPCQRVVPSSRGEIVMFADARQRFERGTLRALVAISPMRMSAP